MKQLELKQMESINGGDFVGGMCVGIGTASAVYAVGVLTHWWNPVGWVSAAFIAADFACVAYSASKV